MITKNQATEKFNNFYRYKEFHNNLLTMADKVTPVRAMRNGATKVWKSKKNAHRFSIPIKIGLYNYSYITEENAHEWEVNKLDAIQF